MKKLIAFILLILPCVAMAEVATKRIIWKGDSIKTPLSVNVERRITFSDSRVLWADVPNKLKDKLTTQIVGNSIYWTAKKPFKSVRITIGEEGGERVYLLDVESSPKKVIHPRLVVVEGKDPYKTVSKPAPKPIINSQVEKIQRSSSSPSAGYATLVRFAASEVYAPQRLRMKNTGIVKISISPIKVKNLLPEMQLTVSTAAAWRSRGLYITALEVTNKSPRNIALDPRKIRGVWKASLFYQGVLRSYGSAGDNTTLFLISDKPFDDAVNSNPMIRLEGK